MHIYVVWNNLFFMEVQGTSVTLQPYKLWEPQMQYDFGVERALWPDANPLLML